MIEPKKRDMEVDIGKPKGSLPGKEMPCCFCVVGRRAYRNWYSVSRGRRDRRRRDDAALAGAAGIAKFIKSRRREGEEADDGDAEA